MKVKASGSCPDSNLIPNWLYPGAMFTTRGAVSRGMTIGTMGVVVRKVPAGKAIEYWPAATREHVNPPKPFTGAQLELVTLTKPTRVLFPAPMGPLAPVGPMGRRWPSLGRSRQVAPDERPWRQVRAQAGRSDSPPRSRSETSMRPRRRSASRPTRC